MTNEEIITQLQDIKCHCQEMYEAEIKNGDTSSSIWGKDVEALDMAIKALEQESVLDKIKAEIKALSNANPSYTHTCDVVDREDVLDIIDKYKVESEDKE